MKEVLVNRCSEKQALSQIWRGKFLEQSKLDFLGTATFEILDSEAGVVNFAPVTNYWTVSSELRIRRVPYFRKESSSISVAGNKQTYPKSSNYNQLNNYIDSKMFYPSRRFFFAQNHFHRKTGVKIVQIVEDRLVEHSFCDILLHNLNIYLVWKSGIV